MLFDPMEDGGTCFCSYSIKGKSFQGDMNITYLSLYLSHTQKKCSKQGQLGISSRKMMTHKKNEYLYPYYTHTLTRSSLLSLIRASSLWNAFLSANYYEIEVLTTQLSLELSLRLSTWRMKHVKPFSKTVGSQMTLGSTVILSIENKIN